MSSKHFKPNKCIAHEFIVYIYRRPLEALKLSVIRKNIVLPLTQIGRLQGFASMSHFNAIAIPSRIGYPNPGIRLIINDGGSEIQIR